MVALGASRWQRALHSLPSVGWQAAFLVGWLTVAVGLIKYGLGVYSGWGNLFHITLNYEQPSLDPSQSFVLPNAGFAAAIGVLGVQSSSTWITVHVLIALAAITAPFFSASVRNHSGRIRILFIVLVGGPILPVLLEWIGSYDPLTVLGLALVALARRTPIQVLGWLLVGVGHAELGMLAALLIITYRAINSDKGLRLMGVVRGFLIAAPPLVLTYLTMRQVVGIWGGATSRLDLALANPVDNAYKYALVMPAMLFSVMGIMWIIVLTKREIRRRRSLSLVFIVLAISLTLPLFLHDHTRVLGILAYPLVLLWMLDLTPRQCDRLWSRYSIAASIIPIPVFIAGTVMFGGVINFLTWRVVTA
jgi:hypothetical protein